MYTRPAEYAGRVVFATLSCMTISEAEHIHCIGIGGAGVSALAGLLLGQGKKVSGTEDNDSPKTLDPLKEKGVEVSSPEEELPEADVYVYSDAWKNNHPYVLESALTTGKEVLSYFQALGEVSKGHKTIAVAGTHGKTTTTAMLSELLEDQDPTVIVGSIMKSTGSNVRVGKSDLFVVEACEYNDHFLNLSPTILVITNIELDHTDYFRDMGHLLESYTKLIGKLPKDGRLIIDGRMKAAAMVKGISPCPVIEYQDTEIPELLVPGEFNKDNARAALTAAREVADVDGKKLGEFVGTWRRFEFRGKGENGCLVYDDYAHHPTAIEKTIIAAKEHFPGKRVVVAFHPHLYSRTRDFMEGFGKSLALADHVHVAPVYPAREPFDGVTTNARVVEEIAKHDGSAEVFEKEQMEEVLSQYGDDTVFFTMGAGNINTWIPEYVSTNFAKE